MAKQTVDTITSLIKRCSATVLGVKLSWILHRKGDGYLVQAQAFIPDTKTGSMSLQKGDKYYISSHAGEQEIASKLFKSLKDFLEHEAREGFKVDDATIYGPHFSLVWLIKMAKNAPEEKREDLV